MKQKLRRVIIGVAVIFACGAGLAKASLIAAEDFNYSGTTSLAGNNGGTGWSAAWAGTGTSTLNTNTSLSFSGIPSVGGCVDNITTGNATRSLATTLNFNSGTYYLGMLLAKSDLASFDVNFGDGTSDRWRMRWSAAEVISFGISSSTATTLGTYSFTNTLFVVMKYDATAATDTLSMKVFVPGDTVTEPGTWTTSTGTTGISASLLKFSGSVAGGQIDAIRIGTTFADVAPVPEPVTVGMLGIGAVSLMLFRRCFHTTGC